MQESPAAQHVLHPHSTSPESQSGAHRPPAQTSPQPHGGVQGSGSQRPSSQNSPRPQGPSHRPPQPSELPHAAPGAHTGTHSQRQSRGPLGTHVSRREVQSPSHVPPHPSGAPHAAPGGHTGVQHPVPVHTSPPLHGTSQNPPQPSGSPQLAVGGHSGAQTQP
jgi:hypothetical protein